MGYIKNDTYTYTFTHENPTASPIWNSNQKITIGGIPKIQTDVERLEIKTEIWIAQSDLASLKNVINNFSKELFYYPSCKLYDRTTIEEIKIILTDAPKIKFENFESDRVYHIELNMEEVPSG